VLVLLGAANANTSLVKAGGYAVFLFALVGVYLYFGALSVATGGKPVPMGRPNPVRLIRTAGPARYLSIRMGR
jgi:succinate-acetate transporter protein